MKYKVSPPRWYFLRVRIHRYPKWEPSSCHRGSQGSSSLSPDIQSPCQLGTLYIIQWQCQLLLYWPLSHGRIPKWPEPVQGRAANTSCQLEPNSHLSSSTWWCCCCWTCFILVVLLFYSITENPNIYGASASTFTGYIFIYGASISKFESF